MLSRAKRFSIKQIATQAGVSKATVDRVLHERPGVRASTVFKVRQAIVDLDQQRTQLRLSGRTFMVDVVMQTPDRFSSAVKAAIEARRVFDTPSAADGSTTVIEATFRIRPQPAARMRGNTRSVRRKIDSTMDSK